MNKKTIILTVFISITIVIMSFSPSAAWSEKANDQSLLKDGSIDDTVRAYEIRQKPMVSLTFDDASQTVYDVGLPILNAAGIPATFYFLTNYLDNNWKVRLLDLQNNGWEIGSHTRNHYDLTTLSPSDVIYELNQSKTDLTNAGLTVYGFAYPYGGGSRNGRIVQQVKQFYSYARSTIPGNNIPLINQYALKTRVQVNSTSIGVMKSWVDKAIANNEWLTINLHTVDNSGDEYAITPANLTELANYIQSKVQAGEIAAVTMHEGLIRYTQTYWYPITDPAMPFGNNLVVTNGKVLWLFDTKVRDYLFDGYEWIPSGSTSYREWHGEYRTADTLMSVDLQAISPQISTTTFTLKEPTSGVFQVGNLVSIVKGNPFAEVVITQIVGSNETITIAKNITRRFSMIDHLLVTDGLIEIGRRNYAIDSKSVSAFDDSANLVRFLRLPNNKTLSEYSNYTDAEFRGSEINRFGIPYYWCAGGFPFETMNLLREAESGTYNANAQLYSGTDASPKSSFTGVELNDQGIVQIQFIPPYAGNYELSIRIKASSPGIQYITQIDGGSPSTQTLSNLAFGYVHFFLPNLSTGNHTLTVSEGSGNVILDYALLIPASRSVASPLNTYFPGDIPCGYSSMIPLITNPIQP
jgi:peptidoglycan/xylan/chitin deacetylase (PgdA/CDA1 family)